MGSTWEKYLRAGILWDSDLVYLQLTLYTYSILLSSNCIVVKHRGQGLRMRTSTVHKIRINVQPYVRANNTLVGHYS